MQAKSAVNALAVLAVVAVACAAAVAALPEVAESYTVTTSVLRRPAAAAVADGDAEWTPTAALEAAAASAAAGSASASASTEADAEAEFELDASGKPQRVVKPKKAKPAPAAAAAAPQPPLTRAEKVQKQLNGFAERFEVVDQQTDKTGARPPRFEQTELPVDAQAEAERAAQAHADVALAVEQHAEAAASSAAADEAEEEHFSSLLEEAEAAEDEADAELELGLVEAEASAEAEKGKSKKQKPTETSPAARLNENYACYRWIRPPRTPVSGSAGSFAPREGHASWLSGNGKSMYVFGGCDRQTLPKNCYGELKQLNLTTRAWRNRKILGVLDDKDVALRMQGAAHAADTKTGKRLFVFGGLRVDATENSAFSNSLDLLFYDKRQKEWSWTHVKTTGDHPPPSQDATLLLVGDQLLLFGGYSDAGFFNDLYVIRTSPTNVLVDQKDPELWKWKKISLPETVKPTGRRGHSMSLQTTRGGSYRAYVFGGVNGASALNDMHVLRIPNWFSQAPAPKKGSAAARARAQAKEKEVKHWGWSKVVMSAAGGRAIPSARAFHASVVVRPRHLLVFGGCDPFHNHCYDDVLLFNTRQKMWLPTPPSLLQSAMAPVLKPRTAKGKAKNGAPAAVPLPQSPKRRFPPWNPSERKKQTVTLLPHKSRVLVLGGCDKTQCFDDVYEMDLKGVCIDSCGAHGRFIDYRAPIVTRKSKRGGAAKKSFIELAAQHTAEQAQAAFAAQFEEDVHADEDDSEDAESDEAEAEDEDAESEVIDEEELAESQMLEAVELSAEQAVASRAVDSADDDTIDHSDAEINAAALAFVELDTVVAPAAAGSAAPQRVDPENKPPRKMKLIRKKGLKSKKAKRAAKRKAKAKKQKFVLNGADLSKLSLEMLKELNKERSLDAKCMCRDGYTGKFCQQKSKCHLNCSGSKKGLCVTERGTDYCKCAPGRWGQGCEFRHCLNNCTSHGVCTPHVLGNSTHPHTQTICKCEAGFWGKDCSLAEEWRRTELEKQSCAAGCTGMGKCSQNYTVNARTKAVEWFKRNEFNLHPLNRAFDVMSVDPTKIKDPKKRAAIDKRQAEHRKQHAERIKTQAYKCRCRPGFGGDACQHQCPLLCSRHGSCNATGQCVCDSGWSGAGCNVPTCGAENKCTYHGTCDAQKGRCKCNGAFRGPACDIDTSCSGHGKWVKGTKNRRGHCKCNAGWFLEDCSLALQCPGECAKHGRCVLSSKKQRKAARAFKPLSRTSTPPKVKGAPDFALPPLPRVVQGTCVCAKGFQSADCSQKVCPKGCSRHGDCHNGKCQCYPGYSGPDCGNVIHCSGNCTDALHGTCTQVRDRKTKVVKPKCKCRLGWAGADCSQIACPNNCKGAGKCLAGKCQCKPGRFGADCSIKCPRDCSGHGECQSTGKCACDVEYTGADCAQRKSCPSKTNDECSGHGLCHIPSGKCHCEPGFNGKDCSKDHSSCANKDCSGHGKCSFGKCFCQIGFSGDNCELKTVCKQNCNSRGICNMGKCECNPGWAGDACDVQVWDNTCPGNCNNHGLCNKGVCSCVAGWTGNDCNTLTDFCKDNDCSGRGTCVYNKCQCLPGTHGAKCEHGSTCPNGCDAKQGVCLLGVCHCLPGFTGPTCSAAQVCPGVTALGTCSGHGVCVQGTCACEPGWGGVDCGSNMAPQAMQASACPKDCSGAGVCYMGKCFCVKGFGGHDCSIPYETRCPNDCAGHAPRYDQRGVCHLGKCLCHPGYTGESCEVEVTCPAKCSVNGVCAHGKCFCVAGWTGPACDWPLRGGLKARTYEQEMKEISAKHGCGGCSMRGLCIDNKCVCESGYGGAQCEEVAGGPVIARCPNQCNGQGTCVFGKCFCHPGWTGSGCDKPLELACPNDCQRKGICRYGRCFCYPGFAGDDCSAAAKCDAQCGSHGVCLDGRCVCADGFSGEQCNIAVGRTKRPASASAGASASFIEAEANADADAKDGVSLIQANAHAHPTNAAGPGPSDAAAPAGPVREVHVTSYPFSLVGVVLMSVAAGVVLSSVAKCVLDKRDQMQRHEALINPLLVPRNA